MTAASCCFLVHKHIWTLVRFYFLFYTNFIKMMTHLAKFSHLGPWCAGEAWNPSYADEGFERKRSFNGGDPGWLIKNPSVIFFYCSSFSPLWLLHSRRLSNNRGQRSATRRYVLRLWIKNLFEGLKPAKIVILTAPGARLCQEIMIYVKMVICKLIQQYESLFK